jgi:hypothetical protein
MQTSEGRSEQTTKNSIQFTLLWESESEGLTYIFLVVVRS